MRTDEWNRVVFTLEGKKKHNLMTVILNEALGKCSESKRNAGGHFGREMSGERTHQLGQGESWVGRLAPDKRGDLGEASETLWTSVSLSVK